MKFYDCSTAPSPRRVRIFIAEKGLEIETVEVDLKNAEHLSDSFRKINPHCTVPVLELDDGTTIAEIPPICHYLEETHPEPNLLGADPKERALIAMWDRYMEFDGVMAVAEALRNRAKGMQGRALTGRTRLRADPRAGGAWPQAHGALFRRARGAAWERANISPEAAIRWPTSPPWSPSILPSG